MENIPRFDLPTQPLPQGHPQGHLKVQLKHQGYPNVILPPNPIPAKKSVRKPRKKKAKPAPGMAPGSLGTGGGVSVVPFFLLHCPFPFCQTEVRVEGGNPAMGVKVIKHHLETEHEKGPKFLCHLCKASFLLRENLELHGLDDHNGEDVVGFGGEGKVDCPACKRKFWTEEAMDAHKFQHHSTPMIKALEKPPPPAKKKASVPSVLFPCLNCEAELPTRQELREHNTSGGCPKTLAMSAAKPPKQYDIVSSLKPVSKSKAAKYAAASFNTSQERQASPSAHLPHLAPSASPTGQNSAWGPSHPIPVHTTAAPASPFGAPNVAWGPSHPIPVPTKDEDPSPPKFAPQDFEKIFQESLAKQKTTQKQKPEKKKKKAASSKKPPPSDTSGFDFQKIYQSSLEASQNRVREMKKEEYREPAQEISPPPSMDAPPPPSMDAPPPPTPQEQPPPRSSLISENEIEMDMTEFNELLCMGQSEDNSLANIHIAPMDMPVLEEEVVVGQGDEAMPGEPAIYLPQWTNSS